MTKASNYLSRHDRNFRYHIKCDGNNHKHLRTYTVPLFTRTIDKSANKKRVFLTLTQRRLEHLKNFFPTFNRSKDNNFRTNVLIIWVQVDKFTSTFSIMNGATDDRSWLLKFFFMEDEYQSSRLSWRKFLFQLWFCLNWEQNFEYRREAKNSKASFWW